MLREMEMNPGGPERVLSHDVTAPTLSDLGIGRMASHRWQKMGAPENGRC